MATNFPVLLHLSTILHQITNLPIYLLFEEKRLIKKI